jgi:hypothetical protein
LNQREETRGGEEDKRERRALRRGPYPLDEVGVGGTHLPRRSTLGSSSTELEEEDKKSNCKKTPGISRNYTKALVQN